jgi:drug/metabolite transporter (DMT)-like permease
MPNLIPLVFVMAFVLFYLGQKNSGARNTRMMWMLAAVFVVVAGAVTLFLKQSR